MAALPVLMPKLGLTMTEGVIVEWSVAPGGAVKTGEILFVVETDKISNEVAAAADGVLASLNVRAGETARVGDIVATLSTTGAIDAPHVPAPPQALEHPAPSEQPSRLLSTPLARRLARQRGLDLAMIAGSGPRGRIAAKDVAAAPGADPAAAPSSEPAAPPSPAPTPSPTVAAATIGELRPLDPFRKVVARRLTAAKREIPHFYVFGEADVTALVDLRPRLNEDPRAPKISVNHFVLTALARALADTPDANLVWTDEGLLALNQVDVGMAVEAPKGLVAPVLRDVGGATLDDVALAATAAIERARAGRLSQADMTGGASAVSNVGMFGATGLLPIINPGQSSILGVGASQALFRPDAEGKPCLRHILNLALSCDHRVIDGAVAARFLQKIGTGLEAPLTLLRRPSPKATP